MYRPLAAGSGQVDLPALEREVLKRWSDERVFERTLARGEGRPQWIFYEGPPTANGMPGVHHVEARVFKDVFPRFKTMKGFHVPRRAGWDCHGLPVEVAVEKELGISGKKQIEAYGVAEFNDRCRESVLRHIDAFEELTERMGYWVDLTEAYRTMNPSYVESVWWSLKVIFDKGLLVRDYRISPYCPRCETPLSDHEMGQPGVYQEDVDPAVTVRFPVLSGPVAETFGAGEVDLLIWTTTPWTLVSNALVAVAPDVTYVVVRSPDAGVRPVLLAEPLVDAVLGEDALGAGGWQVAGRFTGRELERSAYRRPFDLVGMANAHFVALGDFVTTEDGTGLVHCAPTFGADDFALCRAYGVAMVNTIGADGHFLTDIPRVGGEYFKEADPGLVDDLRERGLLLRAEQHAHSYPHCWRCHSALLYYALPSWYIRTTAIRDELLAQNETTNWYPDTIKHGRFGEWLRGNVDWALSRSRYWGTPLPLWECDDGHITCVGSLAELAELTGRDLADLDPHRPYVDEVTLNCPACGRTATRVPDVIDAWYDSGSMPFAQWGAPHQSNAEFEAAYPADYICEAIDQTRGWFYTLMAVGTAVFGRSSYRNVVCLGHILAEDGRKMSKHLGNVLEPLPLMERYGADALRWFMAASGVPWASRRVGPAALEEIVRKVLLTYWNTASFFVMYANASGDGGWSPAHAADAPAPADRPLLDRWLLAELHRTATDVEDALENFDTARAGRTLSVFVDDLSNWYVRRARRRFWAGAATPDGAAAFATLQEALDVVTRLLAPFVPFTTDYVWDVLRADDAPDSVHLTDWPEVPGELADERLTTQMALVRRLVELGRAARASSGVKTRQPLARALVAADGFAALSTELVALIANELNVGEIDPLSTVSDDLVQYRVKPNFRALGKRFGKGTPAVAAAITDADPAALATALRADGAARVTVDGEPVRIVADEVIVTEQPHSGWAVAADGAETLALDLEITPELRRAGLARDAVRFVQDARKSAELQITDRIALYWESGNEELAEAMREHGETIAAEVLATRYVEGRPADATGSYRADDAELHLTCRLLRA